MIEQETVQADQPQDEQVEESKVTTYGKEIVDCHGKQDGSLGKLLEKLSTEVIHDHDFKNFKRIYGEMNNNAKCSCGTGKTFHGCCKRNWNLLDRAHKNRKKMDTDKQKGLLQHKARIKYSIVLEIMHDGSMNTRMLDEGMKQPSMDQMESMFHMAYENFRMTSIMQIVKTGVNHLLDARLEELKKKEDEKSSNVL